ncbi:PAS domain-containing sensor histidine kinase [Aedoeadaptatus coxii]|uniref:sensor histidine kinase n=1 Tax=Aedoeadaptatus coxii TaxID=755172 RepID=UPI002AD1D722|nr:PAS domain-containing sensor histidine kinase [Peptoniphilus coxii]
MNKTVRLLSVLIAFVIALVFQLAASVESNHREGALKEESANKFINILREEEVTRRVAILNNSGGREYLLYLDGEGKVLFSNLSAEKENALRKNRGTRGVDESWHEVSESSLEKGYFRKVNFRDGSSLFIGINQESLTATNLHFLPYTLLLTMIAATSLYHLWQYATYRDRSQIKQLFRQFRHYVVDHHYQMELPPQLLDYEAILIDESSRLRHRLGSLESQLQGLNDMIGNMTEGVILVGDDEKIITINYAAVKLLNGSIHSQYINKDFDKLCGSGDFNEAFHHIFAGRKKEIRKFEMEGFIIKCFFDPVFNGSGGLYGMLLLLIDETQQSLAERSRREFTSNVTHELKTPLTSISGYAELLRSGMVKEEDRDRFLDIILKESDNLFRLIDTVISFSRLEEKNRAEEYRTVDIEGLLAEIIAHFAPEIKHKELHVDLKPGKDNRLYTHPVLMKELLTNLVDNAIAYNVEGGSVTITINDGDENDFILTIEDTGIGISYDDQRRIFERFYMVDKSRSYNEKSTGLGLAIVKHNVENLKGTIDLKSQLNHGSVFTLRFPKSGTVSTH